MAASRCWRGRDEAGDGAYRRDGEAGGRGDGLKTHVGTGARLFVFGVFTA